VILEWFKTLVRVVRVATQLTRVVLPLPATVRKVCKPWLTMPVLPPMAPALPEVAGVFIIIMALVIVNAIAAKVLVNLNGFIETIATVLSDQTMAALQHRCLATVLLFE